MVIIRTTLSYATLHLCFAMLPICLTMFNDSLTQKASNRLPYTL